MIGNDRFVQVFGSVPAGDTSRLVQIVANAVREGFHIVLCTPGGDTPVCTLPVTHQKREHECGTAHVLSLESLLGHPDPWAVYPYDLPVYEPKELAKVRAKVQAIVNRVTKQHGGPPNIAVIPGPSGYVARNQEARAWNADGAGPTVISSHERWYWYTTPKVEIDRWNADTFVLVPPSSVNGHPLRIVGQTNPAPAWLLARMEA